jgi:N-acetylglutamate synthase-like GNAT family acetyltransferase
MYEIKRANEKDFDLIKSFLFEVPAIDNVDEEVLKNASVLYLDDKIYGIISYELFFNYALIRYFVFKRNVDEIVVRELFDSIEENISNKEIDYIFSLVNQGDIYNLFSSLDFKEISKEDIFIEEQNFENSKFKETKLMIKKIQNV